MRYFLLGLALWAGWTSFSRYDYWCRMMDNCGEDPIALQSMIPRSDDLDFKVADETIMDGFEQFGFQSNSPDPELTDDNNKYLEDLAAYLKANPNTICTIEGRYLESEKGKITYDIYENGVARAAKIKDILVGMGVDGKQLALSDRMILDGDNTGEYLAKPVAFLGSLIPDEYDNTDGASANANVGDGRHFSFEDMDFSDVGFATNSAELNPTQAMINYAEKLVAYFEEHPEAKMTLTGHADKRGTDSHNYDLGMRRAKAVKAFFIEKGSNSSKFTVKSKGEKAPIDNGDSEAAYAKNRRVNAHIE